MRGCRLLFGVIKLSSLRCLSKELINWNEKQDAEEKGRKFSHLLQILANFE